MIPASWAIPPSKIRYVERPINTGTSFLIAIYNIPYFFILSALPFLRRLGYYNPLILPNII